MEKQEIIRKIKSLLATAADHKADAESHSALLLARKWMLKYQIQKSDLEDESIHSLLVGNFETGDWWKEVLAAIIAENFRVRAYYCDPSGQKETVQLYFYGLQKDLNYAKKIFELACDSLCFFLQDYQNTIQTLSPSDYLQSSNDYLSGFLGGLQEKFKHQHQLTVAKASTELALVVSVPPLVEKHFVVEIQQQAILKLPKIENRKTYSRGYEQASRMILDVNLQLSQEVL